MYKSGRYPNAINITIIINNKIRLVIKFDILTNVGIVDTGNFIFVTK